MFTGLVDQENDEFLRRDFLNNIKSKFTKVMGLTYDQNLNKTTHYNHVSQNKHKQQNTAEKSLKCNIIYLRHFIPNLLANIKPQ